MLRRSRQRPPGGCRESRVALDAVIPVVYAALQRIAARCMARERPGHDLQPSDLIAETYLRLAGAALPRWSSRAHFCALAARNMRQILIEHGRKRMVAKRGGGEVPRELRAEAISSEPCDALRALDEARAALAGLDRRRAATLELVYFAGLSQAEVAYRLDVHVSTVARDLRSAEAWLRRELVG